MMMALQMEEIFCFDAIGVAGFVASKLQKVFFQWWRLTAASARLVCRSIADVVVVIAADERRRRSSVLLINQLKLFIQVDQLLSTETSLADWVKLNLAQRRRRGLLRLQSIRHSLDFRRRLGGVDGRSSSSSCWRYAGHQWWRRSIKLQSISIDVTTILRRLLWTGRARGRGTRTTIW